MTGSGPGTVRAAILCALALAAPRLGGSTTPDGAVLALLVLLAANPYNVANAGLQFSFLATLGILLFGRRWSQGWLESSPRPGGGGPSPWWGWRPSAWGPWCLRSPVGPVFWEVLPAGAPVQPAHGLVGDPGLRGGRGVGGRGGGLLSFGPGLAALVGLPIRFFFCGMLKRPAA